MSPIPPMTNPVPASWHLETDVIVVGGGGTGLAAAVSSAESGASVVLLEKMPELGGTTGIAIGSYTAACSSLQKAAGIVDNATWHNEDMAQFAAHREPMNNGVLRQFFAENAAETLSWLHGFQLEFYGPSPEPPNRVARMHNVVPNAKAYIAALHRYALKYGAVVLTRHNVETLYQDGALGIVGVRTAHPAGHLNIRARKGVILAAGDYSSGDFVKQKYLPPNVATIEDINPNATGDGHLLAENIGADLVNMNLIYGPEIRFIAPPRKPFTQLLPTHPLLARLMARTTDFMPRALMRGLVKRLLVTWQHPETALYQQGAVLINSEGARFTDETAAPELDIPQQPGKIAYILLDKRLAEIFSKWPHFISTAPDIAYAYLQDYRRLRPDVYAKGQTPGALAKKIGVAADELERTVAHIKNTARGLPDTFGRSHFQTDFSSGPYYALGPVKSWIVHTEGGLRLTLKLEVLDRSGHPIPGLYGGGTNAMGGMVLFGHGLHIAWALTSGRLAGRNAARRGTD
ncbi:MAG: FAD-dependent oxidoreductase [bacterium]|nr:FAD-dependent oxidoreductase [bacterium]